MLVLLPFAASQPPARPAARPVATVTILSPVRAEARGWAPQSDPRQREIVVVHPDGRFAERVRVTEYP